MKLQNFIKNAKNIADSIEQAKSTMKGIKNVADSIGVSGLVAKSKTGKSEKKPVKEQLPEQVPLTKVQKAEPVVKEEKSVEIDSLEDMTNWLSSLQAGASQSVQSALKAQLQVIQFVQSPTLVDTTIDTLVLNLKKTLEEEPDPLMQKNIHERFSLMIQNYVFFLDARLQMEINDNKQEAMKLCDMAGDMLSHSVVDVAMMAMPGGVVAKGSKLVVKNVFAGNESATKNFFGGLVKFLYSWNEKEQKVADFYKIIYGIIMKLDKYSDLIGKSMLISNMIDRYTPNLADYEFPLEEPSDGIKSIMGLGKQKNKFKLLRENIKIIELKDDIDECESNLKEMQENLKKMGNPWLPAGKKAKKELEEAIENTKLKLKSKQKELKDENKYARINFEKSLHSIAEKFNEI